ncbi:MAG: septum site-determining protein MinC [Bacillota bacterium]|jgi:septum site-determining protein MinC|nr:septum site-determining protein MinC [Clostridia bacterium]
MLKELIKIKGTRRGLVFYFNTRDASFEELKNILIEKFQSSNGFFTNARFIISSDNDLNAEEIQIIENICKKHGLVKSESRVVEMDRITTQKAVPADNKTEYFQAEKDAVLLTRNIRSGQKVYVKGNAVILGDVNPGAQIAATGSIIIMGTMRGIAHAGSQGDDMAYVMAFRLRPTQIRISDKVCRAPESQYAVDYPEVARIVDNQIILEPYQSAKRKVVNF